MKKILASLAAAGLLVAGVATAAVITGGSATAQETEDDETTVVEKPERGAVVRDVLEDLVAAGDIDLSDTEIDAILNALDEKWAELQANRPQGHRGHHGFRHGFPGGPGFGFHVGALLEDGVIDAAELAELPEGHPLTDPDGPFGDALADDGQITEQEFQDVIAGLREQMHDRFGGGFFGPPAGDEAPSVEGTSL